MWQKQAETHAVQLGGAGGEDATLTGEVLDAACYLAHGRKGAGPGHRRCADECINKKNFPIGLLTDDGTTYLLVPDHADEAPYEQLITITQAGEAVTVVGLGTGEAEWFGEVRAGLLTFGGDRAEDGGTTTARFELTVAESGTELAGREFWTWTDGRLFCPDGESDVVATRQS